MNINLEKMSVTVTIINKLNKADSTTNQDVWVKHQLKNCVWSVKEISTVSGTNGYITPKNTVIIPQIDNANFLPYKEWKKAGKQVNNWTVSQNDYIVLGEVTEDITPSTITSIMAKYEPNACKIRLFDDRTIGQIVAGKYTKYASHYYVEGV